MALEWIKSYKKLERDPKTLHFMSLMDGWSLNETIGFLHRFWWWADDVAPSGVVSSVCRPGVIGGALGLGQKVGDRAFEKMKESGWLDVTESGEVVIHNILKYRATSEEKKSLARERVRKHREMKRGGNADVTQGVTRYSNAVTLLDEEEDKDKDHTHLAREPSAKLVEAGKAITLTPDGPLRLFLMEYDESWIFEAIKRAVDGGHRDWYYVRGILKRFQREGFPNDDDKGAGRNHSRPNAAKAGRRGPADFSDVKTGERLD